MSNRSLIPNVFNQGTGSLKEFNRALQNLEQTFDSFWKRAPLIPSIRQEMMRPDIDVIENDKLIQIIADLPGLTEKDIHIELNKDIFTLTGEKSEEHEEERNTYHVSERSMGYFSRTFQLPTMIDESKVEATLHDGVLKVTLPKTAEAEAQRKKIEIKQQ